MAIPAINIFEACAGTGMLGRAVRLALDCRGYRSACVGLCERDACAAAALVAGMEAEGVGCPPVWDDLATLDGRRWRGCVDIAIASLPCPAYSSAGKRLGNDDPRAWGDGFDPDDPAATWGPVPHFLRFVNESRPAVVFFENVPEWVSGGYFAPVHGALRGLGYTVERPLFLASEDAGASHERERVFVLAVADACRGNGRSWSERLGVRPAGGQLAVSQDGGLRELRQPSGGGGQPERRDCELAHADDAGLGDGRLGPGGAEDAAECDEVMAHACRTGREVPEPAAVQRAGRRGQGRATAKLDTEVGDADDVRHEEAPPSALWRGQCGSGARCGDLPLYAPGRDDYRAWAAVARLDPARMPATEPGYAVVADGVAWSASDLLRLGGNGVDPLVAALAFGVLWDESESLT